MFESVRTHSEEVLIGYRNEASIAIFDALHERVSWMTAQRIHDIISKSPKSHENPYIQNYPRFIGLLYIFVTAGLTRVIRRENLNGEYFEEWADEAVLFADLEISDDSTKEAGTLWERILFLLHSDGITIHKAWTDIASMLQSDAKALRNMLIQMGLSADTLFYKYSSGWKDGSTNELPKTPEILILW